MRKLTRLLLSVGVMVAIFAVVPMPASHASKARTILNTSALVGNWRNVSSTGGIVRLLIRGNPILLVHGYGRCVPRPCDWGTVRADTYATNVSSRLATGFIATFRFGFKTTILTGYRRGIYLITIDYNLFRLPSTRSNYYTFNTFRK